ncbi:ATPase [Chroococcidiopsis sp. TS-821]|nr:ATPase [Chroococcidiopsis sp. TS-821]
MIQAIHTAVPGRARYRIDKLYRCVELKQHLEFHLSQHPGIVSATANPLTGNILVRFELDLSADEVEKFIAEIARTYNPHAVAPPAASKNLQKTVHWHALDVDAVLAQLQTSNTGLTQVVASQNLQKYGANTLPETATRSEWSMLLEQFQSLPVGLLCMAAGLSVATGGVADALVIMGVVGINAAIGYFTESQSEKIIHSLKSRDRPLTSVVRDRQIVEINTAEVVPGDILVLKAGNYVAADARLIVAENLSIDESALTGESLPASKSTATLIAADIPLGDRINMAYKGTLVLGGQGLGVVVATGKFTEIGKIQAMIGETPIQTTPLARQLDEVGSQLVMLASGVCALVFAAGWLRGYGLLQMLKTSISLAVAAVPEGLPTIATTILALGIQEMRKHKILARSLNAVEALGAVQTICLDKTGTITKNQMSVVEIHADTKSVSLVDGHFDVADAGTLKLIQIAVLCNESVVTRDERGEYVVTGSATENALVYMAIAAGIDVLALREQYPLIETQPRAENRNYVRMLRQHQQHPLVAVKGNPIEVLDLCRWRLNDGERVPLTDKDRLAIALENERMAGKALRVLGVAYGHESTELIWLGLIGMADPVRRGVKDLIAQFHQAGIDTVMITGDQTPTAYAIAKELKLSRNDQIQILDAQDLVNINREALQALCDKVDIFARISPANKLQIVQALQAVGKVVAMTGDGINDAPALKAANVGVAMGKAGTDAAREVADIILEDNNLETMIVAVSQGRTIYNNIRKAVHFLLATNLSEIIVMAIATAGGFGQPLNALQLLWLNLVTDIFPALALALEPAEPDILQKPPRSPDEPIVKASDFQRILFESATLSGSTLAAYAYGIARYGIGMRASTIAFMSLTLGQLLHALSCRTERRIFDDVPTNHYLNLALGGSLTLQFLVLAPGLRNLLKLTPLDGWDLLVIASSALFPLVVNEGTKNQGTQQ